MFIEINQFICTKNYFERQFDIGYIGRFSDEKGVLNFLQSIPLVLDTMPSLNILIAGEGILKEDIENFIEEKKLHHNIVMQQWIPNKFLSDRLNEIRLLVIPSVREGLPNIALEAMASGTAVLATPVGSIPGIIINERTGFILEDNNPNNIAKGLIQAMNYSDINKIVKNANLLVNENYSFHKTVKQLQKVLFR